MSSPVRFHDGRPFTSEHFGIRDRFRKITTSEMRGITLAWRTCAGTSGYSIILVKSEGIIARALEYANVSLACMVLEHKLQTAIRRDERFSNADALFVPYDVTTTLTDSWLGRERDQLEEGDRNGMQERALITPRYHVQKRGP